MGEMKKNLKLYESQEASKQITLVPYNRYVPLPSQKEDKESDIQLSGGVPLNQHPNDINYVAAGQVIPQSYFNIEGKFFICAQ